MTSLRANNLSLKNQGFAPLGSKNVGFRTFEFVVKTQFLCSRMDLNLIIRNKSD